MLTLAGRRSGPYQSRKSPLGISLQVWASPSFRTLVTGPTGQKKESTRTVAEGGDCCEDGGVEDSAVIVEADEVEVDDPGGLARFDDETRQGQDVGAAHFGCALEGLVRVLGSKAGSKQGVRETHARRMLRNRDERTWAWSGGGPGRNSGEHNALKSTFGTAVEMNPWVSVGSDLVTVEGGKSHVLPMKPWFGRARSGGAISRVIPHTTEVLPSLTRAEDGAVETEPARRAINTRPHHPHASAGREATVQENRTYVYAYVPRHVAVESVEGSAVRAEVLVEEAVEVRSREQAFEQCRSQARRGCSLCCFSCHSPPYTPGHRVWRVRRRASDSLALAFESLVKGVDESESR